MNLWRKAVLFYIGGAGYMAMEVGFRGWSHGSMFVAGGTCFLLLGRLRRQNLPEPFQMLCGAGIITLVELGAGLAVNRDYSVWDYRNLPLNYRGQISLPFSLMWIPVGLLAGWVCEKADEWLIRHKKLLDKNRGWVFNRE